MKTREELQTGCADLLRNLRTAAGLTQQQIADMVFVDVKTWRRYESGESVPTIAQFLWFFQSMRTDALAPVLAFLYPETYDGLAQDSDVDRIRAATVHYFQSVATEHELREVAFLVFGGHGSNWRSQLEEWTMLDHLPMDSRLTIAALISEIYALNEKLGRLVSTDHVMPDVNIFNDGLEKGREAAYDGRNAYTTI